jgi:hypothetical protein
VVVVAHIVTVAALFREILPVPKFMALVLVLLLLKIPQVRVKVLSASVPLVKVTVLVVPATKLL